MKKSDVCSMAKTYKQKLNEWYTKHGELPAEIQSQIDKLVREFQDKKSIGNPRLNVVKVLQVSEGTKFVREYNGRKHEVIALAKGFKYKKRVYKSLSAIAYDITNTKWNGKRFFGVHK